MPFSLSFSYIDALWLLLLLPIIILMARRGGSGAVIRKRARRLSIAIRLLIVTLIVLSLAGLQLVTTSDKLATVFLLDVSDSVGAGGRTQAMDFARQSMQTMKDNQQAGIIVFGQDALVEKLVSKDKNVGNLESTPVTGYTNLAEAVRLGTALLPSDAQRRLVLISDGNQNVDEVRNAAKIAASNDVQIDVVPLKQQNGPEVSVSNLQVPNNLRQGEEFSLKVAVDSNYAGNARLLILQDGQVISDRPVELKEGTNLFNEQLVAKSKGFANYTARVIASKDTLEQNNEMNAYSLVKGGPRALLVEGHPDQHEAANLQAALTKSGIEATTIPPDKFPNLSDLTQYDSVVLVDVPASSLTTANMNTLQAYVKDLGKGMVMVGGEESYGLGGYFRTPVEDMLPVELQLPSKLQTPSVAMVMVIDRSGSMADSYNGPGAGAAGIAKIELAKDAAYLAATQLSNTDQVGIVVFDTQAQWQVPLGPMGNPSNLVSPIGRIAPGGGTNIYSGFAPAVEALKNVNAKNKHIIILTDGQDSEGIDYRGVLADANKAGITVSTVGLGEDVNSAFLQDLAQKGGGRYTFVNDPSNLPKIFAKEAHLAARSYIVEEPFTPAIADPSPILQGISGTPQLKGYVATRIKSTATQALVTNRNEPLLAHWQYGLGRVAAWTSDAKGRWATDWLGWQDFPRFWSQMVRWTVAENETGGLQVQTKMVGNRIYVTADAISPDSQYLNGLDVKAKVVSSTLNGSQEDVTLTQTAPGHYEGYFTPKNAGSYIVNVQGTSPQGQAVSGSSANANINLAQTVGAVASYSPEYKQLGTNEPLLKDLVNLTGGHFLTKPEQAFSDDLNRTTRKQDLWPWLLLLAILLFPLDIAARRIRLSPGSLLRGFREKQKPQMAVASASAGGGTTSSPHVGRLFEAKQRAANNRAGTLSGEAAPPARASSTAVAERPEPVYYQPTEEEKAHAETTTGFMPVGKFKSKSKDKDSRLSAQVKELHHFGLSEQEKKQEQAKTGHKAPASTEQASDTAYSGLLRKFNRGSDNEVTQAPTGKTDSPVPENKQPGNKAAGKASKKEASPRDEPRPAPPPPPAPPISGDEVTGRLLKAKQRVREDHKKQE
ncbi:MAG TPA: VWA domain-containing protein [Chloroflexia bacterium]|nr:VWA domain-containing protein [Chloroflexia bacterium]